MSEAFPEGVFPLPHEGIDGGPFWEAAREHRLVIQQCADCGELRHPPRPVCDACQSFEDTWKEVPGTGELFTYTITHYPVSADHDDHVPYNVSVVLLDGTEDVRLVTQLVGVDPDDIEIGMPVEVTWRDLDDDISLPLFEPAT